MSSMSVNLSNVQGFYADYTAGKFESTAMVGGKITLSTKMFNSIASLCSKESSVKQRIIRKLDPSQVKYLEEMEKANLASTIDFKSLNNTWMLIRSLLKVEEEFNQLPIIQVSESFEWENYYLTPSDHSALVIQGRVKGFPFISFYKGGNSYLTLYSTPSNKDQKIHEWSVKEFGDFFGDTVQPLAEKTTEKDYNLIDTEGRLLGGKLFLSIAEWVDLNYLTPKNKYKEVHQELMKLAKPHLPSDICDIVMSYYFKKIES